MPETPFTLFDSWFTQALASEPEDPNAMAVATVDADGRPSVRMVLLKGHDERGFVFYTNLKSRKGLALTANPQAALLFHWKSLRRQIRIEGAVEPVSDAEADTYFASRARDSRIGAWASDQSRPLPSRVHFLKRVAEAGARYAVGDVPRPAHWSGFRIIPDRFEFWQDQTFRLHERRTFVRAADSWDEGLLFP